MSELRRNEDEQRDQTLAPVESSSGSATVTGQSSGDTEGQDRCPPCNGGEEEELDTLKGTGKGSHFNGYCNFCGNCLVYIGTTSHLNGHAKRFKKLGPSFEPSAFMEAYFDIH